jgi:hypothetical protein
MQMHMFLLFVITIATCLFCIWGSDDFCFFLVFTLLVAVLYIVSSQNSERFVERFTDDSDANVFLNMKSDVIKILQPKFENLVASFKGEAKVDQTREYDINGEEVFSEQHDEVVVDSKNAVEIRIVNKVLCDIKKFDPGFYYSILAKATGIKNSTTQEEYVL